jgi:hypothetical protein
MKTTRAKNKDKKVIKKGKWRIIKKPNKKKGQSKKGE